jgi:hypothetical protein
MYLIDMAIFMTVFGGGLVVIGWIVQKIRNADTSMWW